jgi:hypothetical protein
MALFGKIFISSTRQRKTAPVPLVGGGRGPALHRMQGVALNLAWFRGGVKVKVKVKDPRVEETLASLTKERI